MQKREQSDTETGFQYLRARYYNPETGRFTTKNTWEGNQSNPITLNKYLYGNGNPVMMVDPSGEMSLNELLVTEAVAYYITLMPMIMMKNYWGNLALKGIPSNNAFKKADATITGISGGISGGFLGYGGGLEILTTKKGEIGAWFTPMTKFGTSLPLNYLENSMYIGNAYNIYDSKGTLHKYDGTFYLLSRFAVLKIRPDLIAKVPLAANFFSGGNKNSSYGWSVPVNSFENVFYVSISYYIYIGVFNLYENIHNSNNPFFSSEAWDRLIKERYGKQ